MTKPQPRLATALADRYRLLDELGEGGMATVYLAEDLRHDRKVAVKVLRPELAAVIGAERFLSEIKTTANLQHPHILPLFDSGEADGFLFYVMPYVEGETVRDRLTHEKQLPVADAVRIATEVAAALDYAHRHGIIHRDIKPENILLHDGSALVADFGIALAASKAGSSRMTETGMSLGTPHYMSPEQAMGEREITARSDVYALGCVLYEMLTGEPPFGGPTAQAIIARVVTESPRSMVSQRHTIPPQVEAAVFTALEKLPADRFATAAEFAAALSDARYTSSRTTATPAQAGPGAAAWRRRFLAAAAVAAVAVLLAAWGWARARAAADQPTIRQYVTLGDSLRPIVLQPALALSPDGETLVLREETQNGLLWVKQAGALKPTALPGTERASNPVFSPDGQWIAFVADGQLRKVRVSGGAVVKVADSVAGGFGGAAWLDDGTMVYVSTDLNQLIRVSEDGGETKAVLNTDGLRGVGLGYPVPLPGARGVLFQACSSGCVTMSLRVLNLKSGEQKLLLPEIAQGWYLPDGHLLYVQRDGTALIAPFDLGRLDLTGVGVPALNNVLVGFGFAQLAWAPSGTLIYLEGVVQGNENVIVRVGLDGTTTRIDSTWVGRFTSLAIAPDGHQLAVGAGAGVGGLNIWIKQLERGPFSRLSFGGGDRRPTWSPDGRMVAFIRDTAGKSVVAARTVDGSRPDTILAETRFVLQEVDWSRDGRWLVVRTDNANEGAGNILGIQLDGDTALVPLVTSPFTELHPAVSPDVHWLAYTSNESGRNEVYVRPFPNTRDGRWQVSTSGGESPRWAPDGRTLYFLDPANGNVIAAHARPGPGFAVDDLTKLFDGSRFNLDSFHQAYDIAPDGRHFYFISPREVSTASRAPAMVRIDHWFRDLKARSRQ